MSARPAPPTGLELQHLSQSRLSEAKVLLDNHFFDGAAYLAGYALELALKARICKLLDSDYPQGRNDFQSFMTHSYGTLVRLAGLERLLDQEKRNTDFATNWSLLNGSTLIEGWSETWRYRKIGSVSQTEAAELINALDQNPNGILPWIHTLW